jgi:hypothetical protein
LLWHGEYQIGIYDFSVISSAIMASTPAAHPRQQGLENDPTHSVFGIASGFTVRNRFYSAFRIDRQSILRVLNHVTGCLNFNDGWGDVSTAGAVALLWRLGREEGIS